jgi:hypothetical protein
LSRRKADASSEAGLSRLPDPGYAADGRLDEKKLVCSLLFEPDSEVSAKL